MFLRLVNGCGAQAGVDACIPDRATSRVLKIVLQMISSSDLRVKHSGSSSGGLPDFLTLTFCVCCSNPSFDVLNQ